jgi:hypothetical protein
MGEWLKPAVLKTVSGASRSGVRIPLPPPVRSFWQAYPKVLLFAPPIILVSAVRKNVANPSLNESGRSTGAKVCHFIRGPYFLR